MSVIQKGLSVLFCCDIDVRLYSAFGSCVSSCGFDARLSD